MMERDELKSKSILKQEGVALLLSDINGEENLVGHFSWINSMFVGNLLNMHSEKLK